MMFKNRSPIKILLSVLEVSGVLNKHNRPWSLINIVFHDMGLLAFATCAFLKLYLDDGQLSDRIEAVSVVAGLFHIQTKFINIMLHQAEIQNLFNRLEELRTEILQDSDSRHHVINADNFLRKFICSLYILMMVLPVFSLARIIASGEREIPFQVWVPWGLQDRISHIKSLIFVTIITVISANCYITCCTVLFFYSFVLSSILKTLQIRLQRTGQIDKSTYRLHVSVNQLIREYNRLFSGQLYFEIMLSSLQPCGFFYTVIKNIKNKEMSFIEDLFKASLTMFYPFCICVCGEEINSQTEKLHGSSYMNQWYEEKPKNRKDLLNVMTVTVKPNLLSYRQLLVFNYALYTSVVQGMYSFMTMLINFVTAD